MNLIEIKELYKTYYLGEVDVPVLKGITLNVAQGELVALMGASGSGKSTLMNILGCLDRPTSGEYWLDGQEISGLSKNQQAALRNSKIGFVFQSFNLLPRTGRVGKCDDAAVVYAADHPGGRESRQRAMELLQRVGLGDRMYHEPSQLSGGQQQRVAIARSLVNRPSLLFADEPTGNLDSHTSQEILAMFEQLNREEGITIILVTHDPEVAQHARRMIHIKDGLIDGQNNHPGIQPPPLPGLMTQESSAKWSPLS